MKKMARSGSSHSSARSHREPCGAEKTARSAANESRNFDMFLEKFNTAARILVVRPGALGDTILALPALQALAAGNSRAVLELVGYPSVLRLLEHARPSLPIRKIHSIDRALFVPLFSGPMSDELEEFLVPYDLLIAWIHDRSGDLLDKVERLPIACLQADPYPPEGSRMHASEHMLGTLAALGPLGPFRLNRPLAPPRLQAPPAAFLLSGEILRGLGLEEGGFIAMHSGSGSARKNWPAEKFAALLRMAESAGRQVLVLEGESDGEAVRKLGQLAGGLLARVQEPSLLTLAAILSRACAFVGNDSGVSHLAAATGTPTLAIFGPTDPAIWAPRGPRARVLGFETPIERVWVELDRLLSSGGESPLPRHIRGKTPTK